MFLLSHHPANELHRTYAFGNVHLCARCLGTYPALALTLVLQLRHHTPIHGAHDFLLVIGLTLPALVDWAIGQFRPHFGNNALRTLTGAGLGVALGRSIYIHLHAPFPAVLLAQLGFVTAVAVPVILWRIRRAGV